MSAVLTTLKAFGRGLRTLVGLIRTGDDDVRGTYPEHYRPTGPEVATRVSINQSSWM